MTSSAVFPRVALLLAVLVAALLLGAPGAAAQSGDTMLPEESAAKARELLQSSIRAIGGPAYLGIRDITCEGKFAVFSSRGDVSGFDRFYDFIKLPDKSRTEFSKKRNIITVRNGQQGWELDRGGIQEATAAQVAEFQDDLKKDFDSLLRYRLNEEGMSFRYLRSELLDLRRVDWIEIVDRERRTMQVAFDRSTHLPARVIVVSRDPETRRRSEEITFYSNYQLLQGVRWPLQVWREQDGRKVFQLYYDKCTFNAGLEDAFFTREALEQTWAKLNKGKKK
jgi:hypothetical protein